jgi:hypothetical protein
MGVVEEQVVFWCQLDSYVLDLVLTLASQQKDFAPNCFERANFLGSMFFVLYP